ncbi:MAG: hypothetical protein MI892_28830 [Desulfobacterales bacterium]|nr:hypothetical protein [Desulfobacterales bacterium]
MDNVPQDVNRTGVSPRLTRTMHIVGTLWFVLCVAFILVTALREAGFHWWIIFSLSGHSALIVLLLLSVYLFALFRGVNTGASSEVEHPLTSTDYYMIFYMIAPLLGGGAGLLGSIGLVNVVDYLQNIALGTFATTFLVWVIIDPGIAIIETMLPEPRASRQKRLKQQKAMREERQRRREQLLTQITQKQEEDRKRWQPVLEPSAIELVELLQTDEKNYRNAEMRAVEIGADAWRLGGITCMRRLHEMAIESYDQKHKKVPADYITYWWDGIGTWRSPIA